MTELPSPPTPSPTKKKSEPGKNLISDFLEFKTDPFNAYSSVIASISSIRFVHYSWNNDTRECEKSSTFKSLLFYFQVINQFLFFLVSFISFAIYSVSEDVQVEVIVPDCLLMIGFAYALSYQINSLLFGEDAEFHVNQQAKLDKIFCELLGVEKPDGWNRKGILYYFCLMCNSSRPIAIILFTPFFLKSESAMSLYYRLGGESGKPGWYMYAAWCGFNSACSYSMTNYYAILILGHTYFTIFWLKAIRNKIGAQTTEYTAMVLNKVYRMLEIHNRLYFRPYSRLLLPAAIFFASAWFVFSVCCLLRLFSQISYLTLIMVATCAGESVVFLTIKFYSCHRMTCLSEEFIQARRALNTNHLLTKLHRSYTILQISVGSSYTISVDNMFTWSETVINYILLLLSVL